MVNAKINELREEVNALDAQIVALLDKRMEVTDRIAGVKGHDRLPIEDLGREREVLSHVKSAARHPVLQERIDAIYAPLISCAKSSQALTQAPTCPFAQIGIIGLGLIGGSLLKAIKAQSRHTSISALEYDSPDLEHARASGLVDQWHATLEGLCASVELLILAVPPNCVQSYAAKIAEMAAKRDTPLVLCDVAGVKGPITHTFELLGSPAIELVATHPMSGKEHAGFLHSSPMLFASAPWIITPHKQNSKPVLTQIKTFIAFLGADPLLLNAEQHDEYAAFVSHFPGLLSELLLQFVKQINPESIAIAGPGFQSMTRLAHDNLPLRREVIKQNRGQVMRCYERWVAFLQENKVR